MNRQILRGMLLILALVAVLLLLYRNRLPFGKSNSSFACGHDRDISRIEFRSSGKSLTLEKIGENWFVNGKKEARKSGIVFIIRILREIEIKSPVSPLMFKTEITLNKREPVKVRVWDGRKLIRSFLVYKTSSNIYGNIMKIREKSKPFIVYIPGYEQDIGSAFTLNDLFWLPYTVFSLLPSEIASVEFENMEDTASSFSITRNKREFFFSTQGKPLAGWDTALVRRYLSYFAYIPFEQWALDMDPGERARLKSQKPLYRITVTSPGGEQTVLTLWQKMKKTDSVEIIDSDRLYGKTRSSDEFFVIRYFDIDPLLKKNSYFFRE
jgi:hypothetical protein